MSVRKSNEEPLDADQSLIADEQKAALRPPRPPLDEELVSQLLCSATGDLPYLSGQRVLSLVLRAIIDANPGGSISPNARLARAEKALLFKEAFGGRPRNEVEQTMLLMAEAWIADRAFDRTDSQRVTGASLRRRPEGRLPIDSFAESAIDQLHPSVSTERRAKLIEEARSAFSKDRASWIAQLKQSVARRDPEASIARAIVEILAASGCPVDPIGLDRDTLTDWSAFDAGEEYQAWIDSFDDV